MRDLSSLMEMQVIAADEGKRLGVISQTFVDLAAGELVAVLLVAPPGKSLIMAADFQVIGQDALMVPSSDVLKSKGELEEGLARSREVLENPPMVITDNGTRLGQLANVMLADDGRTIIKYGISGGPLRDAATGATTLPILKGTVHGQDTIIVPHDAAHKYLAETTGGLRRSLDKLSKLFKTKYEELSERSEEIYHESEERLRAGGTKARERAEELVETARKKVREVADEMEEEGAAGDIEAAKEELMAAKDAAAAEEDAEAEGCCDKAADAEAPADEPADDDAPAGEEEKADE